MANYSTINYRRLIAYLFNYFKCMEPSQNQTSLVNTTPKTNQQEAGAETNQTPKTSTPEINHDTLMGILCYLGPLVLIPYMTSLDDAFVKFHVKQGLVLFGLEVIIYLAHTMFYFGGLYPIIMLLNLGTLLLTIIGIVNVVGRKEAALPLVGQLADQIKI